MSMFEVNGHQPSILPSGNWKMVFSDEFDGSTLDRTKWDFRTSMMGKPHEAWTTKGVELDGNSNLVFTVVEEDGRPVSAQLQTGYNFMDEPVVKSTFFQDELQWNIGKLKENLYTKKYGYFECRCKLQQKNGWWSAFWLQSPIIGASLDPAQTGSEIDIMECFKPSDISPHNVFTGGYGLDSKVESVGGVKGLSADEFHLFGVKWDENGYIFYIDGKEDGKVKNYVSKTPEFILISTEVSGYRHKEHAPVKEAFEAIGDQFIVDHIRVFEHID